MSRKVSRHEDGTKRRRLNDDGCGQPSPTANEAGSQPFSQTFSHVENELFPSLTLTQPQYSSWTTPPSAGMGSLSHGVDPAVSSQNHLLEQTTIIHPHQRLDINDVQLRQEIDYTCAVTNTLDQFPQRALWSNTANAGVGGITVATHAQHMQTGDPDACFYAQASNPRSTPSVNITDNVQSVFLQKVLVPNPICGDVQSIAQDEVDSMRILHVEDMSPGKSGEPDDVLEDSIQSEIVCFGMIPGVAAKCDQHAAPNGSSRFAIKLQSSDKFSVLHCPEATGRIQSEYGQMIQGLLDESSLDLQAYCVMSIAPNASNRSQSAILVNCTLEITVCGPYELYDEISSWFEDYEIFLQDPRECHMDVKYCNPQRLSSYHVDKYPMLSEIISQSSKFPSLKDITSQHDLLDILNSHVGLEEAAQPQAISQELQSHQKQALTFMLQREKGWAFKGPDVWETVDTDRGRFFVNQVSGTYQLEEPPQFRGGIIADPMGLGKTLTMIALTATDLEDDSNGDTGFYPVWKGDGKREVSTTLIIIPPPLLGTWEEQLAEHVEGARLQCRRHHDKIKLANIQDIEDVNIILTTYNTVSIEWGKAKENGSSILFSVHWRRIILDEAHYIRNGNTLMSQAVCSLAATSRWAVTGTPIQNRLGDLASLFKFIRVHPYTDTKQFEADITHVWKSGDAEKAVKRLQRLSACLVLRRPKATINLPSRRDMQYAVDFSDEERSVYQKIREQAIIHIDQAMKKDVEVSRAGVYVNVLQQIESLRLVCNLGLHYHSRHDKAFQPSAEAKNWEEVAQRTFDYQREMGSMTCTQCSSSLELTESFLDDAASSQRQPQFFRCLSFICRECVNLLCAASRPLVCGHDPSCPGCSVSLNSRNIEDASGETLHGTQGAWLGLPSKVEALLADICTLTTDTKCIVFSTWRLSLDIVEAGLKRASIGCARFDGKVPHKQRQEVVERFRTDASIRVMLLTLSCGAVGLNLTVASRAYLMEPHWNPTLEEQALARVHRLGQKRDVTTVRLYIRDSFEQQVMQVQESKKQLAGILLSPHDGGQADDSLGRLQKLRSLL